MSIIKLITNFKKKNRILFTTPSHNQGSFIIPKSEKLLGKRYFEADYSEIEGFDNLAAPEGAILESQLEVAKIYDAKKSYYLINGSTSGIVAAMISTLEQNDKVLIARNCHKSVYNGLVLTGAYPVWVTPRFNQDWGIFKPIGAKEIEQSLAENMGVKAVIITSPTYEGMISDIGKISQICKEKNVKLIVDEAHGALWNFDKTIGTPAIYSGADISVQSLHKTSGAINPSAILHISHSSTIEEEKITNALNLINTTSPSYPLMANMEATIEYLNSKKGKEKISKLTNDIIKFKNDLSKFDNIHIFYENNDITKILIKIDGLSGFELSDKLFEKYKIEDELANEKSVLFLTGIGTNPKKLKKLQQALVKISKKLKKEEITEQEYIARECVEPKVVFTPAKVYNQEYKIAKLEDSVGKICNELVVKYPPGMPVIVPGELIQQEHVDFLREKETIKILP